MPKARHASVHVFALLGSLLAAPAAMALCPYDPDCLDNPYGAGKPYNAEPVYVVPSP
jgi:hypothetical protein